MSDAARERLHRLADRAEIHDCLCRYARGVDRGDLDLVRSTYHPDAYDDHVDYKGGIDGFIEWLVARFTGVDNSIHFLGNCLIEFAGEDSAFVETYFASRRLLPPAAGEPREAHAGDRTCRQSWGRYLDHFERRNGEWRVAKRVVAMEAAFVTLASDAARRPPATWGERGPADPMYALRAEVFAKAQGK